MTRAPAEKGMQPGILALLRASTVTGLHENAVGVGLALEIRYRTVRLVNAY